MAVTLGEVVSGAKDLADYQGNAAVSDITWRRWINQAQEELYRFLFRLAPSRFNATVTFTLAGGANSVALATGWRRVFGVTKDPASQPLRQSLRTFNFEERDAAGNAGTSMIPERRYDIQGNNLVIEPASYAAGNYAYYYTIGPTKFATDGSQDASTFNAIFEPYVDFIEHHAAIKALGREESDTGGLRVNLQSIMDGIESEFGDSTEPSTIVDVEATGGSGIWP
jgi:hypothetical protein